MFFFEKQPPTLICSVLKINVFSCIRCNVCNIGTIIYCRFRKGYKKNIRKLSGLLRVGLTRCLSCENPITVRAVRNSRFTRGVCFCARPNTRVSCCVNTRTRSVGAVDLGDLKADTPERLSRDAAAASALPCTRRGAYSSLSLSPVTYCHTGAAACAPPSVRPPRSTLVSAAHVTTVARS